MNHLHQVYLLLKISHLSSLSNEPSADTAIDDNSNNNNGQGVDFPSELICPIDGVPPEQGARFLIGPNGKDVETYYIGNRQCTRLVPSNTPPSTQVFEYNNLYRAIAIQGPLYARNYVKHPISGVMICRTLAMECVQRVSSNEQAEIDAERNRLGLTPEVEELDEAIRLQMEETMEDIRSPRIHIDEIIAPQDLSDSETPTAAARRRLAALPLPDSSDSDSNDSILDSSSEIRSVRRRLNESPRAALAANGRVQMGGFVNQEGTDIRSRRHAAALIGVLQLARSGVGGIIGSLGHTNRNNWLNRNLPSPIFDDQGPCHGFIAIRGPTFARHLRAAQTLARTIINRYHSNEPTGAGGEAVPEWARQFIEMNMSG